MLSTARVLGLPAGQAAALRPLAPALELALDAVLCPPTLPAARRLQSAVEAMEPLVHAAVAAGVDDPADGLIGALLATGSDRQDLASDVRTVAVLQLVAGTAIAVTLLANTVEALLGQRDHWETVCRAPERAADAVAETLRWAPPVRLRYRITQEPVRFGDVGLDADQHVVVLVDAAQRAHGDTRDYFLPDRTAGSDTLVPAGPTAEAVVTPLARLQATIGLATLAAFHPRLRAAAPPVRRLRSPVTRAITRFPVTSR